MSTFRDKVDDTEYFENEDTVTQPAPNSSSSPEAPEASEDTEELRPQQSNESENIPGEELVDTDPEPTTEIAYGGTADVDICAEELREIEEIKKQWETGDLEDEKEAEDEDIHTTEPEATPKSSYRGLADVDVCAGELHSSLQDDEPQYENDSRDLTDESFTGVSESPAPVAEESSESQDVLDAHDASGSPMHIEQDSAEELNDVSDEDKPGALPAEEEDVDDLSEDAQNTLSEMADTLFEEHEEEDSSVRKFDLNEEMERVLEETNTFEAELGIEEQDVNVSRPETEAVDESLSSLGKVGLEDGSAEVGHYNNVPSKVVKENDDDYNRLNKSEVVDEGDGDRHRCASETGPEDEDIVNKEAGAMDTDAYSFGASMENQGDDAMNETEIRENLSDGLTSQESEGASHDQETQEDIEEQHASDTQRQSEETEIDMDQEEQTDSQKGRLESEDKEAENRNSEQQVRRKFQNVFLLNRKRYDVRRPPYCRFRPFPF